MYAKHHFPESKKVYAIGIDVLANEFKEAGFNVLSSKEHDDDYGLHYHDVDTIPHDEDVDLVVFGFDPKLNFYKITYGSYCIKGGVSHFSLNKYSLKNFSIKNFWLRNFSLMIFLG